MKKRPVREWLEAAAVIALAAVAVFYWAWCLMYLTGSGGIDHPSSGGTQSSPF